MAYASGTGGPIGAGERVSSVPGRFLAGVAQFFGQLGAAIRVSAAVEARRQPDLHDLEILGLKGTLPLPR